MLFAADETVFVAGETGFAVDGAVSLQNRQPVNRRPRYVFAAFG